jgi:hypothetical protein
MFSTKMKENFQQTISGGMAPFPFRTPLTPPCDIWCFWKNLKKNNF